MNETSGEKIKVPCTFESMNGVSYGFTEENTPFEFRSFITVATNEQFTNPRFFDTKLWVNSILETKASPEELLNTYQNQFYNSKATGFGAFMGGIATAIGLVLIVASEGE
jgi:hypothetical protein